VLFSDGHVYKINVSLFDNGNPPTLGVAATIFIDNKPLLIKVLDKIKEENIVD
jgi:hypothetical protein